MSSKRVKVADEQFKLFVDEVREWMCRFGMGSYEVWITRGPVAAFASTGVEISDRNVVITLAEKWPEEDLTDFEICNTAFHEVCEVLLAPIRIHLEMYFGPRITKPMIHEVVMHLYNGVFCYERGNKGSTLP